MMLQEKIELLPDQVKKQLADYIDFLVEKYQQVKPALTETEKQTLDSRYTDYLKDPSQSSDIAEVKDRLLKQYGVSS